MHKNRIHILSIMFLMITNIIFSQSLGIFEYSDLQNIKSRFLEKGEFQKEINVIKNFADEEFEKSPYTIVKYTSPKTIDGTKNDYYSDSPYWWPNPEDSSAPYIRNDGVRNPDRFMNHKIEAQLFYKAIIYLSFANYFTDDPQYSIKVNDLFRVWFIDEATKMNPNLKYSQMIRNRTRKRGVGIIEGRRFAFTLEAIKLLYLTDSIDNDVYNGVVTWYKEFLTWLTESYYGLDEKQRGNNHSTWWSVQVAAISDFVKDEENIKMIDDHSKHYLLDNQIDKDSRQPLEEERTKSLSYSVFNTTAHSYLNAILYNHKIDNWNYININGKKLTDVIDYLLPYTLDPTKWELKQISTLDTSSPLFLAYTGLKLNNINYLQSYSELSKYDETKMKKTSFDPMQIIADLIININLRQNGK